MDSPVEVTHPADIARVLGTNAFLPLDYAKLHQQLGAGLGFDVTHILFAIDHIPVCLRGHEHTAARKRIAGLIAKGADGAMSFIRNEMPALIAQLHTAGRHDVMAEFVDPCVSRLICAHAGIEMEIDADTMISRVFSQTIGVAKRKRLNSELGAIRAEIERQQPALNEIEIGDRLALFILGTDALRGTIARSLHFLYEQYHENAVPEILTDYPLTGVPVIGRVQDEVCPFHGQTYAPDTQFKARLDVFENPEHAALRNRFFGYGARLCLGRKLALNLWQHIQENIRDTRPAVSVADFALRKDDLFNVPSVFEIEVAHV
ncbi:hypothetical protein [Yoonia algicola]|uniref:Cytochrome P450 n=1 Tax=Yoonia algicola TaxID=3137368 RepID=A0AAN0NGN7_9RHOB